MSRNPNDHPAEDLIPLLRAAQAPDAAPEDRVLASVLGGLYPDQLPPNDRGGAARFPNDGWSELEPLAAKYAHRRRRRYLLRELLAGFSLSSPRALALCGAALVLVVVLVARSRWGAAPAGPTTTSLATARASLPADRSRPAVRLLDGAEVRLAVGRAEVDQANRSRTRIHLGEGTLHVRVPRLGDHASLVVATQDAEVIVHGTRFDVQKDGAEATSVTVYEGLVEVRPIGGRRPPVFVRPGEHVTVPSAAAYRAEVERRVQALVKDSRCDDPDRALETYLAEGPQGADVSAVLYLLGYCAGQRGELDQAIGYFRRVAASSTDQLRADNAMARTAQYSMARSRADGDAAWRLYLERFPNGLHAALARRTLSGALR